MAKVTLEFDSYEEAVELENALNGSKWSSAFWELDQALRNTTKYGVPLRGFTEGATSEEIEAADRCRELIREVLSEYSLKLG